MNKNFLALAVVAIVIAGGAGYGGYVYGKKQTGGQRSFQFTGAQGNGIFVGANGQRRMGGGAAGRGGSFYTGEVLQKNNESITLKLMDGGSKIIFLSNSTTIGKMSTASLDDVSAGTNIVVTGKDNSDGSATANSIQIRPAGSTGMPGFGGQRPANAQ